MVDIFSDKAPQHLSENLKKMTIHHVLSMSCGMDKEPDPAAKQDPLGYGYQIWLHEARGVYRATGAMGQYTIVDPYRDVIISFTENDCAYDAPDAYSKLLNMFWDFLDEIAVPESIVPLEASNLTAALKERMDRLSLPAPKYQQYSPHAAVVNESVYRLQDTNLSFASYNMIAVMAGMKKPAPLEAVQFIFADDCCTVKGTDSEGKEQTVKADMRGGYHENYLGNIVPNRVLASAYWEDSDSLCVVMRWIETAEEIIYHFRFQENLLTASFIPETENFSRNVVVSQGKREDAALC